MNRSVVIHHNTAWWRSHRATSRCTAGRARRQRSGRGGKRVAWATPFGMLVSLSKLEIEKGLPETRGGPRWSPEGDGIFAVLDDAGRATALMRLSAGHGQVDIRQDFGVQQGPVQIPLGIVHPVALAQGVQVVALPGVLPIIGS